MLDNTDGFTDIVDMNSASQNKRGVDGKEMPTVIESILIEHIKLLNTRFDILKIQVDREE